MALLSISIDLSGSTLVKQAIVEICGRDDALVATLYRRYLKVLYGIERDLYGILVADPRIAFDRLFLVKSIGDEFWYVYEVDEGDHVSLNRVAIALFEALFKVFQNERYLSFHSPEKHSAAPLTESKALRVFNLPVKVLADSLLAPFEANLERYEYLKDIVFPAPEREQRPIYAIDQEAAGICSRLNLGNPGASGDGLPVQVRRDYIGLEVDRFFRLTGCCHPLLLGVGETLMSRLDHTVAPVNRDLDHIAVKNPVAGAGLDRAAAAEIHHRGNRAAEPYEGDRRGLPPLSRLRRAVSGPGRLCRASRRRGTDGADTGIPGRIRLLRDSPRKACVVSGGIPLGINPWYVERPFAV